MRGNPIKVIATKTYPQLEYMFKEGDELTLVSNLYDEDTVLMNEVYGGFNKENKHICIVNLRDPIAYRKIKEEGRFTKDNGDYIVMMYDKVIAPKGSYINSTIITKDGREYSDTNIRNAIGYKSFGEYFKKI